jgi:hypothetical protein
MCPRPMSCMFPNLNLVCCMRLKTFFALASYHPVKFSFN